MPPRSPHELLDQALEDRRLELGMTWTKVAEATGVTTETLSALRKGRTNPLNASPLTRRRIEQGMKWAPGGYDDAVAGRKPTPLADDVPHPEHAPPVPDGPEAEEEELVRRFRELPLDKRLNAFRKAFEDLHQDFGKSGEEGSGRRTS